MPATTANVDTKRRLVACQHCLADVPISDVAKLCASCSQIFTSSKERTNISEGK